MHLKDLGFHARIFLVTMTTFLLVSQALAETIVLYPRPESGADERARYPVKLLEMALQRSGGQYRLKASNLTMLQGRAFLQLQMNDGVNVAWSMTSVDREAKLLPIRIPIDKGLLGWRLLLVKKQRLHEFQQISNVDELAAKTAAQGHDWPDTDILRANHFRVEGVVGYEALFKILELEGVDYFPRSIVEIWTEADARAKQGLVIEPMLALHYPNARYFFVNKNNKQLADDIANGLEKMIADGSFDKLFHDNYDALLKKTNLNARKVFELSNPLLPPHTPLERDALWFRQ